MRSPIFGIPQKIDLKGRGFEPRRVQMKNLLFLRIVECWPLFGMGQNAETLTWRRKLVFVRDACGSPIEMALYCAKLMEGDAGMNETLNRSK
jgi:hypothetical protein